MFKNIEEFNTECRKTIDAFDRFAEKHKLAGLAVADHIGFKCDSGETFDFVRALLENESEFIYQSMISGRRNAVLKLKREIATALGAITTFELADQKPDGSQHNTFDHIEIFPTGCSYDELVSKLQNEDEVINKKDRPHHVTHDIKLNGEFTVRLTRELLLAKIKREQMIC